MIERETSCINKTSPVKRIPQHTLDHQAKIAQEHQNNEHSQQPAVPVKRVVFRLGATVMRQARLTQDTDDDEEGEQRLVMDLEREEVVRRR